MPPNGPRTCSIRHLPFIALLLAAGAGFNHAHGDTAHRPVLRDVQWSVGDSIVEAVLHFDRTPARYTAYALEDPHRIVVDCYDTRAGMLLDPQAPRPIVNARLTGEAMGDEIRFLRLVLFTERAIAFETHETQSEVRVVMQWNTRAEQQHSRDIRRRRLTAFSIIAGIAAAGVTVGIIAGAADSDDEPNQDVDDVIPPPAMQPPGGAMPGH